MERGRYDERWMLGQTEPQKIHNGSHRSQKAICDAIEILREGEKECANTATSAACPA
jgi:hypothetical protein